MLIIRYLAKLWNRLTRCSECHRVYDGEQNTDCGRCLALKEQIDAGW